jgi:hypothetical protein
LKGRVMAGSFTPAGPVALMIGDTQGIGEWIARSPGAASTRAAQRTGLGNRDCIGPMAGPLPNREGRIPGARGSIPDAA